MTDDFGSTLDSALISCCALSSSKLDLRFLVDVVGVDAAAADDFATAVVDSGDLIDLAGLLMGVAILRSDFSSIERRRVLASIFAPADLVGDDDAAAIDRAAPLAAAPDRLSAFWCRSFDTLLEKFGGFSLSLIQVDFLYY